MALRMNDKLNLLILVIALQVTLVALGAHAGFGDMFKKKDKLDATSTTPAPQAQKTTEMAAKGATGGGGGGRSRQRANLDELRAARDERDRLADETDEPEAPKYPKRQGYKAPPGAGSGSGTGRARRRHTYSEPEVAHENEAEQGDGDQDDEYEDEDEYEQAMAAYRNQQEAGAGGVKPVDGANLPADGAESALLGRFTNKNVREQLAAKYVSTHKPGGERRLEAGGLAGIPAPRIRNVHRLQKMPGGGGGANEQHQQQPKKSSSYWGKQINKALKVTKKGIKKGASAFAELPKYVEQAADSVNALLQLDGKGKLLALIEQVRGDIHFVRKEFSQFTLNWSPAMEKALDYLGDTGLDKISWNDRDELDLKKDALHSIVLGYEFMSLMVAWRENLLIAHEAYKLWLESLKVQYEQKKFEVVDEDLLMQLSTIHNYLLLSAWEEIDERTYENRIKLDHLMEIEDDRPKNYESEYFRNIIVLQEMFYPTLEELDREHAQIRESISTSGVIVDNLEQVTEFYANFRESIQTGELTDVDCKVPKELYGLLDKLGPQIEYTPLVYTKGFIKDLRQASEERQVEIEIQEEQMEPIVKPKKKGFHL